MLARSSRTVSSILCSFSAPDLLLERLRTRSLSSSASPTPFSHFPISSSQYSTFRLQSSSSNNNSRIISLSIRSRESSLLLLLFSMTMDMIRRASNGGSNNNSSNSPVRVSPYGAAERKKPFLIGVAGGTASGKVNKCF